MPEEEKPLERRPVLLEPSGRLQAVLKQKEIPVSFSCHPIIIIYIYVYIYVYIYIYKYILISMYIYICISYVYIYIITYI